MSNQQTTFEKKGKKEMRGPGEKTEGHNVATEHDVATKTKWFKKISVRNDIFPGRFSFA